MRRYFATLLTVLLCAAPLAAQIAKPPATPRDDIVDNYFGVKVPDPYQWLENGTAPNVLAWSQAQNAYAKAHLDELPGRAALAQELHRLLSVPSVGIPQPAGAWLVYSYHARNENQYVVMVRRRSGGPARVLIDPNKLDPSGNTAVNAFYPSPHGTYLAYGLSVNGNDRTTLHVLRIANGTRLPIAITRTGYSQVAWLPDESGFYYARFAASNRGTATVAGSRIYFHSMTGSPSGDMDASVYGRGLPAADLPDVAVSPNGRWLVLFAFHGTSGGNNVEIRDRKHSDATVLRLGTLTYNAQWSVDVDGNTAYITTSDGAPNFKLAIANLAHPNGLRVIVQQSQDILQSTEVVDHRLALTYLHDASSRVRIYTESGSRLRDVTFPSMGTVECCGAQPDDPVAYYSFQSFNAPTTIYRYDIATAAQSVWQRMPIPYDTSNIVVSQVWYHSKDGTPISMFLVHERGTAPNGHVPVFLTGYGGFDVSMTPTFSNNALAWVQRGGLYALPNLRGGGEYGEEWHGEGMFANKQQVFDDFIYAAKYLVQSGWTNPAHIAIAGASNGGLLVSAAETQAPQLFKAVWCGWPLTDMLRYQNFLIARLWVSEYGSSANPREFAYLYKYSPYANVRRGTDYPATLVVTSPDDPRVDPMNARKFAARLQYANAAPTPILLRIYTNTGHGRSAIDNEIAHSVDELSFLMNQVGLR